MGTHKWSVTPCPLPLRGQRKDIGLHSKYVGYYYHNGRKNNPYVVIPLRINPFHDLHNLAKENYGSFKQTTTGKRVNWVKMKIIKLDKKEKNII